VFQNAEREFSTFNFESADVAMLQQHFEDMQKACRALLEEDKPLVLPAYDYCLKASHLFNILDARGVVSHSARPDYIKRVRDLACACAEEWVKQNG
jgi:glycyl-tRNA synthetase alpha chain